MMMRRLRFAWTVVAFAIAAFGCAMCAQANMHAAESFLTGGNPAAGEYALGNLVGQGPAVGAFTGTWADGLTTTTPATFNVVGAGLSWPELAGAAGGAVQFIGDGAMANTQSAVRNFDNLNMVAGGVYYLAGMMSFDENFVIDSTSSAYTGILNLEEGAPGAPYIVGLQWGFKANASGGVDAVVRARDYYKDGSGNVSYPVTQFTVQENLAPGNHLFVMRMASDQAAPNSGDYIDVWVDPDIQYSEYLAGLPQAPSEPVSNWLTPTAPERVVDTVVLNATNLGAGAVVNYDEIRFADSWEEATNGKAPFTGISDEAAFLIEGVYPTPAYDHHGTYLRQGSDKIRGAEEGIIVGGVSASSVAACRGLLSYSLDDIPEGSVVAEVKLTLAVKRLDETSGELPRVDLVLADLPAEFDEDEALWTEAASGVPWTNGPGNLTDTVLGTASGFEGPPSTVVYESTPELVAAVQAAIDGDTPLDLGLISPVDSDGTRRFIEFYSDNAESSLLRPKLQITFAAVPEPSTCVLLAVAGTLMLALRRRETR
jgi:hypothetical protein